MVTTVSQKYCNNIFPALFVTEIKSLVSCKRNWKQFSLCACRRRVLSCLDSRLLTVLTISTVSRNKAKFSRLIADELNNASRDNHVDVSFDQLTLCWCLLTAVYNGRSKTAVNNEKSLQDIKSTAHLDILDALWSHMRCHMVQYGDQWGPLWTRKLKLKFL